MFDLRHLRVLREAARLGSLSAAAESLDYTQPAVSQQMAALERRAGMPLLDRTTRGVRLTEAGEALLRHAEVILAEQTLAERELEAIAGLRGGRVRMASFPTAGAALVPAAVSAFIARYPDVALSVLEAEPEEAVPMLRAGELEVALVATTLDQPERFGPLYEGIDLHRLLDEPRCAVLPQDHRLARCRRLRLEDLAGEVWIELGRSPTRHGRVYVAPADADDRHPRVGFRSDDFNVVQGMVAAGAGVAVVPQLALTNLRHDVTVRTLGSSAPMRTVAAGTLAGVHRSRATAALLELLVEVSEEHVALTRRDRDGAARA
jgi:DNA-binding transcriptional LysR family regulator